MLGASNGQMPQMSHGRDVHGSVTDTKVYSSIWKFNVDCKRLTWSSVFTETNERPISFLGGLSGAITGENQSFSFDSPWTQSWVSNTGGLMKKKKTFAAMSVSAHHFKHSLYYVKSDTEQWGYWRSCVMNKLTCLSILARRTPRRAVALWKPCIVFLSCARARFLWRSRVKQWWPSASCKSHGDRSATSPGASLPATEQPPSPHSLCFQVIPHHALLRSPSSLLSHLF